MSISHDAAAETGNEKLASNLAKPARMPVQADCIPAEMRDDARWMLWAWKWKEKEQKWDKPPKRITGAPGSSTDPTSRYRFADVLHTYQNQQQFDGIGFALGENWAGVDLDDVRNPKTGAIVPWAQAIIDKLGTYAEVSPSGTGVKLICRGTLVKGKKIREFADGTRLEMFDAGRYFTITGHRLASSPKKITDCTAALKWIQQTYIQAAGHATEFESTDRDIALQALAQIGGMAINYHDWLHVGMALYSVDPSEAMLADWDRWSQGAGDKYAPGACAEKLQTFGAGGENRIGIGSLIYWAKQTGWKPPRKKRENATEKAKQKKAEAIERGDDPWTAIEFDEGRTEAAFARRFLASYGDRVLWVPTWKTWLVWDGCRWKIDDGACAVLRFAQAISDAIWHEAADFHTEDAIEFADDMSNPSRWASALKAAAAFKAISVADLNANRWLINCPNGTLDLRTGELRPHRREDLLTTLCPTPFDPEASSYVWDRFLDGACPLQPVQDYLRRLMGYALAGRAAKSEEMLPVLWGDGSNGKSVFVESIRRTVGADFATPAAHGLLTEKTNDRHATERASLYGKRFVFCSETGRGAALDEDLIKAMTGGDCIKARFCHKDEFEFDPTFTLFLITNHRPRVRGTDTGIWRRLNLIPWTQRFWLEWRGESGPPELRADPGLRDKLDSERAGILAWMVRGCLEWQSQGLNAPEQVQIATTEYRNAEDIVGQFVAQCCVVMPQARVKFNDFYTRFEAWCEANGERAPKGRTVSSWLQEHDYQAFQSNGRWYAGLALEAP